MSNSIFVPVHRLPVELDEVRQAVRRAFAEFGLPEPEVQLHIPDDGRPRPLKDSIVTVRGTEAHDHCWISFGDYPTDLTGDDAVPHMADVTTRGSWRFAAVVVLALFEFQGIVAFNDSGELDGQATYDPVTLRQAIADALANGRQYLAR